MKDVMIYADRKLNLNFKHRTRLITHTLRIGKELLALTKYRQISNFQSVPTPLLKTSPIPFRDKQRIKSLKNSNSRTTNNRIEPCRTKIRAGP